MRPTRWQTLIAFFVLPLAACKDAPKPVAARPAVLIFTPKAPGSVVVDTTGTEETERLTMVVPYSGDSVARYYRSHLGIWGWELQGDRDADSVINLYAAKGPFGRSTLWIHIERQDTLSARYTLIANTRPVPPESANVRVTPPPPLGRDTGGER